MKKMKKLLALVLVLCMVVGLVACTKPAEKDPTTPSTSTPTTGKTSFKGKTLQIWGNGTAESYTDFETKFGKGNYVWMMRAAIDEWAYINGVTIVYEGSYDQNAMLSAMASGSKPDILFQTEKFPAIANFGIVDAFTEEEYNTLTEIAGTSKYMDMMQYKTSSYGFVYPWSGNNMCYFNKTMFEKYDVKSPLDYFNEGAWNWDNFIRCMEEMTKDLNGDGTIDTYGCSSWSTLDMINPIRMDEKGNVLNVVDEPWFFDYAEAMYQIYSVKNIAYGRDNIQSNVTNPMVAMQLSDCEPYNFEHMFQYIANGDEIMVVPMPHWEGENGETKEWLRWTQSCAHIVSSCDEREAAFDLLCYLMKCGLKYISDFSLGAIKCDYAGIQGLSPLSKQWKEAFAKVCQDRKAAIEEMEGFYDANHMTKVSDYLATLKDWYSYAAFGGITNLASYSELSKMPAASSIPVVKEKYQAALDKYNDLYVFE